MRYYSILRPISIGTYPSGGVEKIVNFDRREYVDEIGREAWGYIDYSRELTEKEAAGYDLMSEVKKEAIDKKQLIKIMLDAGMEKWEIRQILRSVNTGDFSAQDVYEQLGGRA